jgi:hypothetical protein
MTVYDTGHPEVFAAWCGPGRRGQAAAHVIMQATDRPGERPRPWVGAGAWPQSAGVSRPSRLNAPGIP